MIIYSLYKMLKTWLIKNLDLIDDVTNIIRHLSIKLEHVVLIQQLTLMTNQDSPCEYTGIKLKRPNEYGFVDLFYIHKRFVCYYNFGSEVLATRDVIDLLLSLERKDWIFITTVFL